MVQRLIDLRDLTNPQEVQRLRELLIDIYGYLGLKPIRASVRTTDATVTTLATLPLEDETLYLIDVSVIARRTGGAGGTAGDSAGYRRLGNYNRTGGGGSAIVGALSTPHTAEDQAAWDCTLDTNGNDVRVRVTGAANNNVTWDAIITMQEV